MRKIECITKCGDCAQVLLEYPTNFSDLIVTSPPYADCRAKTYGGIRPDDYVEWFLPRSEQFLRVLKHSINTFARIAELV
jgi:site-specific DNA-methyltransferase (adenine-specific)